MKKVFICFLTVLSVLSITNIQAAETEKKVDNKADKENASIVEKKDTVKSTEETKTVDAKAPAKEESAENEIKEQKKVEVTAKEEPAAKVAEIAEISKTVPTPDTAKADTAIVEDSVVGTLVITTTPENAVVVFDDVSKGKSPVTINDVSVGKHSIIIKKKGHFLKKASITVTGGTESKLHFQLIKPAKITITSDPSGATVNINGKIKGKTPYSDSKIKPGECKLILSKDGFDDKELSMLPVNGGVDSLHFSFVHIEGAEADSVADGEKNEKKDGKKDGKKDKSRLARILDKVALGVFIGFSLIILIIELTQNED